jgi:outer membrane protein insertion porin family
MSWTGSVRIRLIFVCVALAPQLGQWSVLHASFLADSALTVSKIVIVGNETTKEYVILREMTLKVGGSLDAAALERDQKQIYSLELFNKVDIDCTVEGSQATVFVRVSERWYLWPLPVLGFKYRDLKKIFYGVSFNHQNFRGRNEKVRASAVFGYDGWFNLAYQNPKLTSDDDIFFRGEFGFYHVLNLDVAESQYDQRVVMGDVSVGKRFGLYLTLLGLAGYNRWEVSDPQHGRTVSPSGKDNFISLGFSMTYDRRDIHEYPTSGSFVAVSAMKSGLGESDVNLFRWGVDLRDYEPLGSDISVCGHTFGSFLSGGISPSYLHAFFGYETRLRGYFSRVLEGEDLVGGTIEVRVPILKPRYQTVSIRYLPDEFSVWRYGLSAGIFADAGTTWYRRDIVFKVPWYAGYGVGLHFLLPYSLVVRTEYALNQHGQGEFILDFDASF